MGSKRIHGRWAVAAAIWMSLAWVLLTMQLGSAETGTQEVSVSAFVDSFAKFGHAALFGILAWLLHRSLVHPRERSLGGWYFQALWAATLAAIGYGVVTELYQGLLPHRSTEFRDAVANSAGVACYALFAFCWRGKG
ncbi:MAG: VanZ family protein [Deltaproteobacteria bacterium]|nr:VanZ family protein [Deltaproteobacteria bacterium]